MVLANIPCAIYQAVLGLREQDGQLRDTGEEIMIRRFWNRLLLADFETSPDDHVTLGRLIVGEIVFGGMMLVLIIGAAAGF